MIDAGDARRRTKRKKWPTLHVYCSCGAEWHGAVAIGNDVIVSHLRAPAACYLSDEPQTAQQKRNHERLTETVYADTER